MERGLTKQIAGRWLNERAAVGHPNRHVQTVFALCAVGLEAYERINGHKRCNNPECGHVFQ
jgi:hypothetical protein